ncbi:baseplate megatron protein TIM-barrel domain-containing protein [Ruegeria lacuscaerulensis]|uniref:baseplate megatron protein TIM-barrel domain-containing protein n=1 Tax=Ruegeria lacuscaerulensis TaxID=55218 RepID=UPI001F39894D|nr:glycoside hydrolase TIM-barrel-like domain-containing protein [Ruegeria lacuscaerulensis]
MSNNITDKPELPKGDMRSTLSALDLKSGAGWLASADAEVRERFLSEIGEGGLCALPFLFEFWALPHQLPPEGDWRSWVIMGGRGAGKTRAGAEWVRSMVEGSLPLDKGEACRVSLVGETFDQVRDVMVFGDSGILRCSPPDRRPVWKASERKLIWPNGAEAQAFSAHDPEGLRGPQFDAAWVDELGCAAIDKGTNQPNKFLDPKSSESGLPRYSNGQRDDYVQVQYLKAMLGYWSNPKINPVSDVYGGRMVDMKNAYVWAWDARPYPTFPNLRSQWSDGSNYARGHWLNGRSGSRTLSSVVTEICYGAGVTDIDVSQLYGVVRGYAIQDVTSARAALQPLMLRYGFDAIEREGVLQFQMREGRSAIELNTDSLAQSPDIEGRVEYRREAEAEMTGRVRLRFVQSDADHDVVSEKAVLPDTRTHSVSVNEIPLSMTRAEGRQTTERWLSEARVSRETARFGLPLSMLQVGAGDVVSFSGDRQGARYRIDRLEQAEMQIADAVRIEPGVYVPSDLPDDDVTARPFVAPVPVLPVFMDLPLITGSEPPHAPYLATTANPWPGNVAVYSAARDEGYALQEVISGQAVIGFTETPLMRASAGIWDKGKPLWVNLVDGLLESRPRDALLNGANLAAIGDGTPGNWEVFQFADATLQKTGIYTLSGRLRGQLGTDANMPDAWPVGSMFILLDQRVYQTGLSRAERRVAKHYRIGPATRGFDDPSFVHQVQAFEGIGLRPYAPVHLKATTLANGERFTWVRRTRVDGDDWGGLDVPLGEESESYLVQIHSSGTLLHEHLVTEPSWTYSEAMKTADGVSGPYTVQVAQVSAIFGPGLPARLTVG